MKVEKREEDLTESCVFISMACPSSCLLSSGEPRVATRKISTYVSMNNGRGATFPAPAAEREGEGEQG